MEHYDDAVILTSPVAARLLNDPSGAVTGKAALRAYFAKGLAFYPDLNFELIDTLSGMTASFSTTGIRTARKPPNSWKIGDKRQDTAAWWRITLAQADRLS